MTKMQVRLWPIALLRRTAATVESTPPLNPRMTLSLPIFSRISLTEVSMNDSLVQSPLHPQMPRAKLARIFVPSTVWNTSGWNWTPYVSSSGKRNAAFSTSEVEARTLHPSGREEIVSPCDIHTWELFDTPLKSGEEVSVISRIARPYSLATDPSTLPP